MECDRLRDAVHSEIAKNVAALLTGLSHPAAFECHFGKLCDVKKFRAPQMVVTFDDSGVDAANVDSCHDRRFFGMLPVDLDLAVEFRELAMSCSEKLVNSETDRGTRLVKFVDFVAERACADGSEQNKADNKPSFHQISFRFYGLFAATTNVFNSGVRDNGNFPNKLPSAKAGSACSFLASWTPAIRASSVSKWVTARRFGSFASR